MQAWTAAGLRGVIGHPNTATTASPEPGRSLSSILCPGFFNGSALSIVLVHPLIGRRIIKDIVPGRQLRPFKMSGEWGFGRKL
jgi:hypothetical protein